MIITNQYNLPDEFVNAVQMTQRDYDKKSISVTELIDPPQKIQLIRRHWNDISADVSDSFWALMGQSIHRVLELAATTDAVVERQLHYHSDILDLFGTPDIIKNYILDDYKVTSAWTLVFGVREEWKGQTNIYAWMANRLAPRYPELQVKKIRIIMIFKDWNQKAAWQNKDYPDKPFEILHVPMWKQSDTEMYVKERLMFHKEAQSLKDEDLPMCTEEEQWAKQSKYAVMRRGASRAYKLFDNYPDAYDLVDQLMTTKGKAYHIEHREGEKVRCERYCMAKEFCHQYKREHE